MEFKKVLSLLIKNFEEKNIRYALIGGFSLIAYGIPRTTLDIDFLIDKDDLYKLDEIMNKLNYKLIYRTENVSQYKGIDEEMGEIDFIHAFRKYSKNMLERYEIREIEDIKVKVLKPEDMIGLKVQAIANSPERKIKELYDIESIVEKFKDNIKWEVVKEYFEIFELNKDFEEIFKKYGNFK